MPHRAPSKERLFQHLQERPRNLGEGNELVLLGEGPGCFSRMLLGITFLAGSYLGLFGGLVDLVINLTAVEASGMVTGVEEAGYSINERDVYRIHYGYDVDGVPYGSFSYSTKDPGEGQRYTVLYCRYQPKLSRIKWATYGPLGTVGSVIFGLWVLLLALLALGGFRKALRRRRLLRVGVPTWAMLTDKKVTNTQINDQSVIKLTFAFDVDGDTHQVVVQTHDRQLLADLQDEAEELMFYLPGKPDQAVLWDQLEYKPDLERPGLWRAAPAAKVRSSIILLVLSYGMLLWGLVRVIALFQ